MICKKCTKIGYYCNIPEHENDHKGLSIKRIQVIFYKFNLGVLNRNLTNMVSFILTIWFLS